MEKSIKIAIAIATVIVAAIILFCTGSASNENVTFILPDSGCVGSVREYFFYNSETDNYDLIIQPGAGYSIEIVGVADTSVYVIGSGDTRWAAAFASQQ